ncbi:MAG: two-component regulator propeller domain-containing protein, partial [Acidobacteriota bacterium]|nr:two-component regulator propeller domain-containing protein [Acidobacteriota bacterium]
MTSRCFRGLLLFIFCPVLFAAGAIDDVKFQRLTTEDGLAQNGVFSILQDRRGFIWFATRDGLNRYDGLRFKVYYRDFDDSNTLPENQLNLLLEDHNGHIWVATPTDGLARLDPVTDTITRFPENPAGGLSNGGVRTMLLDSEQRLWVGTMDGLNLFDAASDSFERVDYLAQIDVPPAIDRVLALSECRDVPGIWMVGYNSLIHYDPLTGKALNYTAREDEAETSILDKVTSFAEAGQGRLWLGLNNGLALFDTGTGDYTWFPLKHPVTGKSPLVRAVQADIGGIIWMATDSGVVVYDHGAGKHAYHQHDPDDPRSLSDNNAFSLLLDDSGLVWVGTFSGGVNKYNRTSETIRHIVPHPDKKQNFNNNTVFSFYEDTERKIWMGLGTGGISRYDRNTRTFQHFEPDADKDDALLPGFLFALASQDDRHLWTASISGLARMDMKTGKVKRFPVEGKGKDGPFYNSATGIHLDEEGKVWVTTMAGLGVLDPETGAWRFRQREEGKPDTPAENTMYCIHPDKNGALWLGMGSKGLAFYDPATDSFTNRGPDPGNPEGLSQGTVLTLEIDRKERIWVGTLGGGLNRFHPVLGRFQRFTRKDGLINEKIFGMIEDDAGFLWLATNRGISRFDPETSAFKNLDLSYNLQGNEFTKGGAFRDRDGNLYFGGANGFNILHPAMIYDSRYEPRVAITNLEILNEPVKLTQDISEMETLSLSHTDRAITFEFASFDYMMPEKNKFAYKVDNLDDDWVPLNRGELTFPKLVPGRYVLRVKGSNHEGMWSSKEVSLKLVVPPPWWMSTPALATYLLLTVALIWFLVLYQRRKLAREREINERLRQVDRLKDEFLANTSHELRTP